MNGWLRLWILISAIWGVGVIGIAAVSVADTFGDADGPWIKYGLSEKAKPFYENLEPDEKGPAYTIEFAYADGTKQGVRFPLLNDMEASEFDRKIKNLAVREGKKISDIELSRFVNEVSSKNAEAKEALAEYQREVESSAQRKVSDRRQTIWISTLVLIVPPLIVLLLGHGIAWVRRGFAPPR